MLFFFNGRKTRDANFQLLYPAKRRIRVKLFLNIITLRIRIRENYTNIFQKYFEMFLMFVLICNKTAGNQNDFLIKNILSDISIIFSVIMNYIYTTNESSNI